MNKNHLFHLESDKNDKSVILVQKYALAAYEKNRQFFNYSVPFFKIQLLYERKQMDKIMKQKTPNWMVSTTTSSQNLISIFSPSVWEKLSSHKKRVLPQVLTHEMAHLFLHQIYPFGQPCWLVEGIAAYVAKQGNPKTSLKDNKFFNDFSFLEKLTYDKNWQANSQYAYQISFHWIDFLISRFGKQKMFDFIKKLNPESNIDNSFLLIFKKPLKNIMKEFFTERG